MAYSTESDITKQLPSDRLLELTDDNNDGHADAGVLDEAIADADEEIDAYLAGRYSVPISPVPGIVKKLSVDITIWNLYSRRAIADETRKKRYESAIDMLKMVAKGTVKLGSDEPASGEQQIRTSRSADDRTFTTGSSSAGSSGSLDNF